MPSTIRIGNTGMRGKIGAGLTPELAIDYASALGSYLNGGTIIVGRDTRSSSLMLHHASVSALLSCGCNVINAGVISAAQLHYTIPHLKASGGLLIGAGHHPSGWNALVPLNATGAYFNDLQHHALLNIYDSKRFDTTAWDKIGTLQSLNPELKMSYIDYLVSLWDVEAIAKRRLKVVIDFCNGSGSVPGMNLAKRLGLDVVPINHAANGLLPHSPEPRPRSAVQVKSLVEALKADIGFVFNSDMSRVSIVTDSGETLSEEYTFPLVVSQILSNNPANKDVVTNICTTKTLDDCVAMFGGRLHKAAVGQSSVIDMMSATGAILAGDGSGSVAMDGIRGFDGLMAMGTIINAIVQTKNSISTLTKKLPRYHIVKKTIPCRTARAYKLLSSLPRFFIDATVTESDGIRLEWPDGWLHLRLSATEPAIRMITEWKTKEMAENIALRVRRLIEREPQI